MAKNEETRAVLTHRRASECLSRQIDNSEVIAPVQVIQASHLARRFNLSPAVMSVVASHAFGTPETWSARHG